MNVDADRKVTPSASSVLLQVTDCIESDSSDPMPIKAETLRRKTDESAFPVATLGKRNSTSAKGQLFGIYAAGPPIGFEQGIAPDRHRLGLLGNALRLEIPALARRCDPIEIVFLVALDLVADEQRGRTGGKVRLVKDVIA